MALLPGLYSKNGRRSDPVTASAVQRPLETGQRLALHVSETFGPGVDREYRAEEEREHARADERRLVHRAVDGEELAPAPRRQRAPDGHEIHRGIRQAGVSPVD